MVGLVDPMGEGAHRVRVAGATGGRWDLVVGEGVILLGYERERG